MTQHEALERLASTGLLKQEPPGREEIAGLIRTGAVRLEDSQRPINAAASRSRTRRISGLFGIVSHGRFFTLPNEVGDGRFRSDAGRAG